MFYVYEHWRPDRDEPFCVGKGKGGRANMMARRNMHHRAIQNKLHKLGMAVEVKIVADGLSEETKALISAKKSGANHPFFGKKDSAEIRKNKSNAARLAWVKRREKLAP